MQTPAAPATERARLIMQTLLQMEKQFGKGSVLQLGSKSVQQVSVIPTGSISLDAALGVGGFPRGRVMEVFGPESSGKTTLALQVIAQAQAAGGTAAFIDAEHALDPTYARALGVDVDNLLVSQPDYGEQALEITDSLVASNVIDVVVVDSVAALVPKAELEGEMGDSFMGLHARLMSQAHAQADRGGVEGQRVPDLHQSGARKDRRGVWQSGDYYRRPRAEVLFLGADRGAAHRRDQGRRSDHGQPDKIKVVKNKVAAPFREVEVDILYGRESRAKAIFWIWRRRMMWWKNPAPGSAMAASAWGRAAKTRGCFLKEHTDIRDKLDSAVRQKLGLTGNATA